MVREMPAKPISSLDDIRRRLLTSISVFVVAVVLFGIAAQVIVRFDRPDSVHASMGTPPARTSTSLLINAQTLNDQLTSADSKLVVIDLSTIDRYDEEHIPGAIHGWWQDGMDPNARSYGELLAIQGGSQSRAAWLRSLGIGAQSTVAVYDDEDGRQAARLIWILSYLGFDRAVMLDGGLGAWKAAGYETTSTPSTPGQIDGIKGRAESQRLIRTDELQQRVGVADPALTIIDVRSAEEADDDLNGLVRIGAIPGSRAIPWPTLLQNGDGYLKSDEELRALFASIEPDLDREVVIYGRFGVDTGLVWLAMRDAGYTNVRIYDGGWATWGANEANPLVPWKAPS